MEDKIPMEGRKKNWFWNASLKRKNLAKKPGVGGIPASEKRKKARQSPAI